MATGYTLPRLKSQIVEFKYQAFIWHPVHPSRASQGFCSNCWEFRRAKYMLIRVEDKIAIRALCERHARQYNLLREVASLRYEIYEDLVSSKRQERAIPREVGDANREHKVG